MFILFSTHQFINSANSRFGFIKQISAVAAFLLSLFLAANSYGDFTGKGHVHTLAESQQIFSNPDCKTTNTCDLKRFMLKTLEQEIWFSDDLNPTHANAAIIQYETDSVAAIEKYAIVQFVKGCVFLSTKNPDGRIERQVNYDVSSFGKNVPLCFPEWVIDSQDTDPVYNSDPKLGRFYFLRWNLPGSYRDHTQKYYGVQKPQIPVVYMADYPAGAFVTANGVKNTSLQFKTCIYKTNEIPTVTQRENVNFAKPLNCFEWRDVYIYNFADGNFRTDLVDYGLPEEPPVRPNPLKVVGLLTALAGFASIFWLRRRFFPVKSNPL